MTEKLTTVHVLDVGTESVVAGEVANAASAAGKPQGDGSAESVEHTVRVAANVAGTE